MSFRRTALAVLCSALTFSAVASAALGGSGNYKVSAVAKVPLGTVDIKGGGKFTAEEEGDNWVFKTNLKDSLDVKERTEHAREHFEMGKHPKATLTIAKSALKLPEDKPVKGTVKGDLKLHGTSKPVTVTYKVSKKDGGYTIEEASFTFDYTQYIPKICRFAGTACVNPPIDVKVEKVAVVQK